MSTQSIWARFAPRELLETALLVYWLPLSLAIGWGFAWRARARRPEPHRWVRGAPTWWSLPVLLWAVVAWWEIARFMGTPERVTLYSGTFLFPRALLVATTGLVSLVLVLTALAVGAFPGPSRRWASLHPVGLFGPVCAVLSILLSYVFLYCLTWELVDGQVQMLRDRIRQLWTMPVG